MTSRDDEGRALARESYSKGELTAAEARYQEIVRLHPKDSGAHAALGLLLMQEGRVDEAEAFLEKAQRIAPRGEGSYQRGLVERASERYPEALESFREAESLGYRRPELTLEVGICQSFLSETDAARETLAPLVQEGHQEAQYWFAVACAQDRDQESWRSQALTRLRGLLEGDLDAWLRARSHFLLASLLDDSPEGFEEAIEHYRAGLELEPEAAVPRQNLGAVHLSRGEPELARRELIEALRQRPGYARAQANLARLYHESLGEDRLREDLAALLKELGPEAGAEALSGLMMALIDETRSRAHEEFYQRGHALKNLLALVGSRIKRLRRRLPQGELLEEGLDQLKEGYDEAYQRLAGDLRLARPNPREGREIELEPLFQRLQRRLEREASPGIEFLFFLPAGLPRLHGDEDALLEALLNLGRNSLEVLEDQGEIGFSVAFDEASGSLEIRFWDSGPGLPEDELEAIFQSGFTTKKTGSGLGLALVRRTVTDFRGQVWASNRPQGGAEFLLRLPVSLRYHPSQGTGLKARPVRLEDLDRLNVDELTG